MPNYASWRLKTHFKPWFTTFWSSLRSIGTHAAHSAAPYGDAFGVDFRPLDVNYGGLHSLIERFEGSGRSGSPRSFDCRIVIGEIRPDSRVIARLLNFFVSRDLPFHAGRRPRPPVPSQSRASTVPSSWSMRFACVFPFGSFGFALWSSDRVKFSTLR